MAGKKLKVGIIGAGSIMRGAHMPGWQQAEGWELGAVYDAHRPTAEALAKDFGIPHVCNDVQDLVKLDLDAVDICTPNKAHTPAALAALNNGKHVICEKPLAVSTAEVKELQAASRKAGKLLMTAQNQRFGSRAIALKKFVDGGNLGEVYHARIHAVRRNWCPTKPTFIDSSISGGGPCMDIGVHALDLGMWLMGFPRPLRVTGVTRTNFAHTGEIPGAWGQWDPKRFDVEDFASGFVHFENGATMVIECAWLQHQKEKEDFSARIFGKKAGITWPTGDYAQTVNGAFVDGTLDEPADQKSSHTAEVLAFADAVATGKPSPVPVEQTLLVIGILEAIVQSGKTGKEVTLDLPAATAAAAKKAK
jgi:predicted dehydrogenase